MKQLLFFLCCSFLYTFSQENGCNYFDAQFFRGNIYKHRNDIAHLISGHPEGILLSYNWKTNGSEEWHKVYNYPDYGISYQYIDFKNHYLGVNHAIGAHYNFYFFNRQLLFRISQGIGITSSPYDKVTNNKNNAFGTKVMDNTYFLVQYKKENIIENLGVQAGFMLTHFSNGRIKAPNNGINTFALTLGLNYGWREKQEIKTDSLPVPASYAERIKYNIAFRTGVSEGPVPHLGQRQFYHVGAYADKRIGRKSALQFGADLFFSRYLDKRVGLFVGHELFINKLSIETQFGYYVYKPFDYEVDVYQRLALKYYVTKTVFTGLGLKTHNASAEAIEVSLGVRL
jgi:hypothetical protein